MKCCNRELTTPFCPMCGQAPQTPLVGLLLHVRTQQGSHEAVRDEEVAWPTKHPDANERILDRHRAKLARLVATVAKWKSWGDALESLLANRTEDAA